MPKKPDNLLGKTGLFSAPTRAIPRSRGRSDLPRRGPAQGAHAERDPGERIQGRRLLSRPSLAGGEVGPTYRGAGIGAQPGPSHLPGETEAARAGGPPRRPGQPGEAAAERPGWAGRDEGGAGPPGRRCPGLHRASTVPAQAGRDCSAGPRPANSSQRRAGLDIFRPENVNTGQKMACRPGSAGVDLSPTYVSRDINMPAETHQCQPGEAKCWPGKEYAGLEMLT
jgi:hypothetical protein